MMTWKGKIALVAILATVWGGTTLLSQQRINGVLTNWIVAVLTFSSTATGQVLNQIIPGAADPEGAVTANPGSLYLRTDGTVYKKGSGTGNTGWVELEAGAGTGDITAVTAGAGLINGGTSGAVTVDVGEGLAIDAAADAIAFDPTELTGSRTWGDASTDTIVWTFNRATGTDPTITFNSGSVALPALTLATPLAGTQGGTGLTAFTRSGNTTEFATVTGAKTSGDCIEFDASGNLVAAGAPCGSGGGGGDLNAVDIDTIAELCGILTDEGTGVCAALAAAVSGSGSFALTTSPTFVTPTLGVATATTLDTGQGANELYDMDQNVLTSSSPAFTNVSVSTEVYDATGWNGDLTVPTKDAVRDLIESLPGLSADPGANVLLGWDDSTNQLTDASAFDGVLNSLSLEAAGVKLSGDDDGAITFLGLGNGSDEDLILNLDDTANTWVFSSSTGVTTANFSGIAIRNAGLRGEKEILLAVCQGSTASLGMNLQASGAATAACDGSTIIGAVVTFADSGTQEVQVTMKIPHDWDGSNMDLVFDWYATPTSGDAIWQFSGKCRGAGETRPTSYSSTPDTVTDTAAGTTLQANTATITLSTSANHALDGCAAGETLYGRFFRDPSGSDTLNASGLIDGPLVFRYGKL